MCLGTRRGSKTNYAALGSCGYRHARGGEWVAEIFVGRSSLDLSGDGDQVTGLLPA